MCVRVIVCARVCVSVCLRAHTHPHMCVCARACAYACVCARAWLCVCACVLCARVRTIVRTRVCVRARASGHELESCIVCARPGLAQTPLRPTSPTHSAELARSSAGYSPSGSVVRAAVPRERQESWAAAMSSSRPPPAAISAGPPSRLLRFVKRLCVGTCGAACVLGLAVWIAPARPT